MTDATPIRTSLERWVAGNRLTPAEFDAMRRDAWLYRGCILVTPGDWGGLGDWLAAALKSWASGKWGRRMKR